MSELPFDPTPPPDEKPAAAPEATPKPAVRPLARPRPVRRPPVVVENSKRDTFIAIACGLGVLVLVFLGIFVLHGEQGKPTANLLTGVITAKHAAGEIEKEITIGNKGLKSQQTDSGFSFTVHVDSENRDYELPVNEGLYHARKIGDKQQFIRPPSEQR
jgi:hypothetical protein